MKLLSKFWLVVNKKLMAVSAICSIVSVVCLCFRDQIAIWIALGTLVLSLATILWAILRVLNSYLEENINGDHRCISSYITYRTDDGDHILFEVHKLIQVKCAIMQVFDTGLKWSGDDNFKWESDLQDVVGLDKHDDETEFDTLKLGFKNPPLYNQTAAVQFKANINDSNHKSSTYVELRVDYPIDYIQVNISLGYKNKSENAVVERKLIHAATGGEYKKFDTIPYDSVHRQYLYQTFRPESGYFYRISWKR